ncbi:DUF6436 domain-containing protein [Stutzerimonas tarimensis]|uniref:DUF6436 domain-containing protein n=1 Tax=Stutzerimonas tarimensis TaxID=1507735 RepID=A0ABV7T3V4_9GAMM
MPRIPRLLIAAVLLCAAAAALLLAIRWYEESFREAGERAAMFSGEALKLPAELAGPGPVRLVHFWDPACPCNVGNQQHLAEMLLRYRDAPVAFYAVQRPGSRGKLPPPLQAIETLTDFPGSETLPASPAVALWDARGELVYLGPYSEGAVCTSDNSFVEPIIDALLAGRQVRATQALAVACFCDWPHNAR